MGCPVAKELGINEGTRQGPSFAVRLYSPVNTAGRFPRNARNPSR
jgi:hypothetical protein